jgi:hypothetical protein
MTTTDTAAAAAPPAAPAPEPDDTDDDVAAHEPADDLPGRDADDDVDDDMVDPDAAPRRRGRSMSESTKQMFAKVRAELKRAKEAGELGDGDLEPAIGNPDPAKPAAAAPVPGDKPADPPKPDEPKAPSIDPKHVEAWERINKADADIRKREAEIEERSKKIRGAEEFAAKFREQPGETVLELVKLYTGLEDLTQGDGQAWLADLIADLGGRSLGIALSPESKARQETQRALRALKAHQAEAQKAEAKRKQDEEAAASTAERTGAISALAKELAAKAATYPHLSAEDGASEIVFSVIEAQYEKDKTVLTWEDAAAKAEKYLKEQADQWFTKRRHLYATAPADKPAPPASSTSVVSQGDPPDHRRSLTTLRNEQAAAAPTPPDNDVDAELDAEAHRKRSKAKLKASIAAARARESQ